MCPRSQCELGYWQASCLAPKQLLRSEVGAILKFKLQYLYQNTRKSECCFALKAILDDCSQIYQSVSHPFRRLNAGTAHGMER
ncbi:hypothetical protein VP01_3600g2 [Puccinia sorghi]|uniref:Uncharacterized protein n=1 Tax=Puccinia sorghi TaxID=27349 RepID=A0A0L6UV20_9BASI|nr:hypothetical protein VP01_3600g2 [Puccinia sorghi]